MFLEDHFGGWVVGAQEQKQGAWLGGYESYPDGPGVEREEVEAHGWTGVCLWESPQGLLVGCMWGVREGRHQGGLLGLWFEKWGRSQRCHLPGWGRP